MNSQIASFVYLALVRRYAFIIECDAVLLIHVLTVSLLAGDVWLVHSQSRIFLG